MQVAALSQAEIDALLSNLGTQEIAEEAEEPKSARKSVKPYDFRRPDKFSKDQVRALQMLHESFARMMSSSLSARLRTMAHATLASIDQGAYNEFLKLIPASTILSIIGMDPLPGSIILEISPEVAFAMIDRLLGGPGRAAKRSSAITDIEMALVRGLVTTLIQDLRDTWSNVIQLTPSLNDIILNPRFIQATFQGDAVIILVFEVKLGETTGTVTICIPYNVLEPIVPKLNAQSWFISSRRHLPTDSAEALESEIQKVTIPVSVLLGSTEVSVEDLLAIQTGDVIRLDSRAGRELEVAVAGQVKYLAQPGRIGNKVAARVKRIVGEDRR
jgi:flagellar motor switch protein FliM